MTKKFDNFYKKFYEMREEIMRHKWIESEKVGRDIGLEEALTDWLKNHRKNWLASYRRDDLGNDGK